MDEEQEVEVICQCGGCHIQGVACKYVAVGCKFCYAPDDYDCEFKSHE